MGLALIGKLADGYNTVNDTIAAGKGQTGDAAAASGFLDNWITNKLPEVITGLASSIVDDGSGAIAKDMIEVGTGDSHIFGNVFR